MKKIFISLLVVVVAILALRFVGQEDSWICVEGSWAKHGNPSEPMPVSGCRTPSMDEDRFVATGRLVMDNPGLKQGVWYLLYERSGSPALTAELSFDTQSSCAFNGTEGACPDILLLSSSLTTVEGLIQYDGSVRVIKAFSGQSI